MNDHVRCPCVSCYDDQRFLFDVCPVQRWPLACSCVVRKHSQSSSHMESTYMIIYLFCVISGTEFVSICLYF